jgi:transposase
MPEKNVTNLLTLPHLKLTHTRSEKRFQYVFCESDIARAPCPWCGDEFPRVHQRPVRTLKDSVIRGRIYILKVKIRRYRCRKCHKTFNEELSGIKKYQRLTERMKRNIYWACENFADLKKVRKYTRCGTKTIFKSYYTRLEEKQRERQWSEWPRTIGIDEHGFNRNKERGHRNFVTMIVDHKHSKVRELLPTRNKAEMISMLSHIPGRHNVRNVTMDLSGTYRSFVKDFFPNAQITADHFHVIRLLHPTINRMRKGITGDKRRHPLRKLLLKNGIKLKVFERKAIWKWLEDYPDLRAVYFAKEAMHRLYRCRGYTKAKRSFRNLVDWLALSKVPELQRLRKTLLNWQTEILNYFKTRLTNARTEGLNNVAKSIIKRSYGFRNFSNYRLRVLNA